MDWWLSTEFVFGVPHEIWVGRANATEVGAGVVDHRNLEAFGVGLLLPANRNMHAVFLAIVV